MLIERVTKDDEAWIKPLFEENKSILGGFSPVWYFYWQSKNKNERWVKIHGHAFAHFLIKKNGERTLYEIAVATKRKGYGKRLIEYIGYPLNLKTDKENQESNSFYKSLGFVCVGKKLSKNHSKSFNIYKKWG